MVVVVILIIKMVGVKKMGDHESDNRGDHDDQLV